MIEVALNKYPIVKQAAQFAGSHLANKLPENMYFHNLDHTMDVVKAVEEICEQTPEITDKDEEIILLAAWFHDLGYSDTYRGHEKISEVMAKDFLEKENYPQKDIGSVIKCIHATEYNVKPESLSEKVISDADLYHLSTDKYFTKSEALRREFCEYGLRDEMSDKDWMKLNLLFIEQHQYCTKYGKDVLEKGKEANILKMKKKLKSAKKGDKVIDKLQKENQKLQEKIDKLKQKGSKPERGIETMFRTTSKNHLDLSNIADNKANIMISINAIIISIILSVMIRKFEDYPNLILPTVMMTLVSLLSIVFAVLATIPNITKGTFTREDLLNKRTNLLFFGNFFRMELKDYEWGMNVLMKDADLLYGSMTRDIFFLGKVLGRKYRLLRICYAIFMYGLVISVLTYGIAMAFFPVYH